jgi:hypothetical protein
MATSKSDSRQSYISEGDKARAALHALDPYFTDDKTLAEAFANYVIEEIEYRKIHLSVLHDVRKVARPGGPGPGFGEPCLIRYEWVYKNIVGISTNDRDRAFDFTVDALLRGYDVCVSQVKTYGGGSKGGLAQCRADLTREWAEDHPNEIVLPCTFEIEGRTP